MTVLREHVMFDVTSDGEVNQVFPLKLTARVKFFFQFSSDYPWCNGLSKTSIMLMPNMSWQHTHACIACLYYIYIYIKMSIMLDVQYYWLSSCHYIFQYLMKMSPPNGTGSLLGRVSVQHPRQTLWLLYIYFYSVYIVVYRTKYFHWLIHRLTENKEYNKTVYLGSEPGWKNKKIGGQ